MEKEFNQKQWQRLETGRQGVRVATLLRVCEVLGTDLVTLLEGLDDGIYEDRPPALRQCPRRGKGGGRPS